MAESGSSGQEKTEPATEKKKQEARDKGQLPRSRELTTVIILLVAGMGFFIFGRNMVNDLGNILRENFIIERNEIYDPQILIKSFWAAIISGIKVVAPLFGLIALTAILAPMALSGWSFSMQSLQPKLDKLDPIKGFKKVFGWKGVIELLKSLGKFVLVSSVGLLLLESKLPEFMVLGRLNVPDAMSVMGSELLLVYLILSSTLLIIAAIDIPYQLWDSNRQQKMTLQEVKDEMKDTEGSPELKGKLRSTQREISQRRMMEAVPNADVVITNPTHFAVALKYDQLEMAAPVVVAIGADLVALQIRRIASANDVPILEAPPLARSLYYHSELGDEIPAGLYLAVAQILAYIYQVKQYRTYGGIEPTPPDDFPIPDDYKKGN